MANILMSLHMYYIKITDLLPRLRCWWTIWQMTKMRSAAHVLKKVHAAEWDWCMHPWSSVSLHCTWVTSCLIYVVTSLYLAPIYGGRPHHHSPSWKTPRDCNIPYCLVASSLLRDCSLPPSQKQALSLIKISFTCTFSWQSSSELCICEFAGVMVDSMSLESLSFSPFFSALFMYFIYLFTFSITFLHSFNFLNILILIFIKLFNKRHW